MRNYNDEDCISWIQIKFPIWRSLKRICDYLALFILTNGGDKHEKSFSITLCSYDC